MVFTLNSHESKKKMYNHFPERLVSNGASTSTHTWAGRVGGEGQRQGGRPRAWARLCPQDPQAEANGKGNTEDSCPDKAPQSRAAPESGPCAWEVRVPGLGQGEQAPEGAQSPSCSEAQHAACSS